MLPSPPAAPLPDYQPLLSALEQSGLPAQVSLRGTVLHIGLSIAQAPLPQPATTIIRQLLYQLDLRTMSLDRIETVQIYGLSAPQQAVWRQKFEIAPLTAADYDLFSFKNRFGNALYFPLALALGILLKVSPLGDSLLWGIDIWFHECGHAVVAWLAGRRAIPLPLGFTPIDPRRSLFVYGGVLTLLGLLFWAGRREQKRWPMVLAVSLAAVQGYMTWVMSPDTFDLLVAFGGIGGEFCLCTLLMVGFYLPLPDYFQWGFYRYPVAVGAAFTFFGSLWSWRQIRLGHRDLPWGSLWGGDGDMEQLHFAHHWSRQQIVETYSHLGNLCLLLLVGTYLCALLQQRRALWALWQQRD